MLDQLNPSGARGEIPGGLGGCLQRDESPELREPRRCELQPRHPDVEHGELLECGSKLPLWLGEACFASGEKSPMVSGPYEAARYK